ncbi:MAG: hypothetical protein KDJ97_22510 [Anaerolineae bacterium]|nr:hypothetical protein [Anaerolineae bacterium]
MENEEKIQIEVYSEHNRGVELIAAERQRQIDKEGYTALHDDYWQDEELAMAAVFYAAPEKYGEMLAFWPWVDRYNKKRKHNRLRQLAIAGALIAAEIDRLQRQTVTDEDQI